MTPWTEETIVAEFRRHVTYWQEKLRLRDIEFRVRVVDLIDGEADAWCSVRADNCGANPYAVDLQIRRGSWATETPYTVWSTVAHECVHVMNWTMAHAFGNEELAYKWEAILTGFFAKDAPRTQPEGTSIYQHDPEQPSA